MKHSFFLIFYIVFLVSVSSCGITRKVVDNAHEISIINDTTNSNISNIQSLFIDTTNVLNLKIEYKKIEYYQIATTHNNRLKPDTAQQVKSITTYSINNNSTKKGITSDTASVILSHNSVTHENKDSTVKSVNINRPNIWAQLKWILLFVAVIFIIYIAFKLMRKYKII